MTFRRLLGARLSRLVLVLTGFCATVMSARAGDVFLEIATVPGESVNAAHPNTVELLAFSWGVSRPVSVSSGVLQAGQASPQDFSFTKRTDKTSPKLMLATFQNTSFATVTLYVMRQSASAPYDQLKIIFENVVFTGYQVAGSDGDEGAVENVSFTFAKVKMEYVPLRSTGAPDTANKVTAGWDVLQNRSY